MQDSAKHARAATLDGFVDWNNSPHFHRAVHQAFIIQDFKFRIDDLQIPRSVRIHFEPAVENDLLSGMEDLLLVQILGMKPLAAYEAAGIARRQIENAEAGFPGDDQSRGQDFNQN